jgi:uncharacterized protein with predicted RNA binding PUA domain
MMLQKLSKKAKTSEITSASSPKRNFAVSKLKMSLDYIFGSGASKLIDFDAIEFEYSRKTGRIRHALDRNTEKVLFSFRPDGSIAPTILGARAMVYGSATGKMGVKPLKSLKTRKNLSRPRWTVTVLDGVSDFVARGKTVFCRHVVSCDSSLLGSEDVVVLNERGDLLGVGRTTVPAYVMKQFKRGVAIKVREGINSRDGSPAIVGQ